MDVLTGALGVHFYRNMNRGIGGTVLFGAFAWTYEQKRYQLCGLWVHLHGHMNKSIIGTMIFGFICMDI